MTWAHLFCSLSLPITGRIEENTVCAPESFRCLPQGPDTPFYRPRATCSHVASTHLKEEEWALVRGLYYAPDPSPGEAANFSVERAWSADGALFPEEGATSDFSLPPFLHGVGPGAARAARPWL